MALVFLSSSAILQLHHKKTYPMLSTQESKLNMYRSVQQICNDNSSIIQTNAAFVQTFKNFSSLIKLIINTATSQSRQESGIAIDKSEAKKELATTATDVAGIIYAYASGINDNTLKQTVAYTYSDFFRLKDDLLAPTAVNILNAAVENMAPLAQFGITQPVVAALQSAIDNYSTSVPRPKTAKSVKATHTANLKALIKEADTVLKEQMDKLIVTFKATDPDFVAAYKKTRTIIDAAVTTTQLRVSVSAAGMPLSGATVSLSGITSAESITAKSGIAAFKPVAFGTYGLKVSAAGYKDFTDTEVVVKQGKINNITVEL